MKDAKIVDLFWKRSERAISESKKKYGLYCNSIAWNIMRNHEDADECEADAYQRAWKSMPGVRPKMLGPYLGKLARNSAYDKLRRSKALKRSSGTVALMLDELEECVPSQETVDTSLESKAIRAIIGTFLEKLSDKKRKMFIQRYWYLRTPPEIADDLGISATNVTTTLGRLRDKLKAELEKGGIEI